MKILSKVFRGIEYIQISQIPAPQREKLLATINQKLFIKILMDGKVVADCLQYKDYEMWYENVFLIPADKIISASEPVPTAEKKVTVR